MSRKLLVVQQLGIGSRRLEKSVPICRLLFTDVVQVGGNAVTGGNAVQDTYSPEFVVVFSECLAPQKRGRREKIVIDQGQSELSFDP